MRRRSSTEPPAEKRAREKKLRTGGRHCPVCTELLPSMGGQPAGSCTSCGGRPVSGRRCSHCHAEAVWEAGANAGCAACGHHGSKVRVFAGQDWLKREAE